MTGTEPDPVAAYLTEARTRAERELRYICVAPEGPAWSCEDVPRLLGAVTEVLALADVLITPQPGDSPALAACGRKLRRIISAELLSEVPADGQEVTPEFREQAAGLMDRNDGLMRRLAGTGDVSDQ